MNASRVTAACAAALVVGALGAASAEAHKGQPHDLKQGKTSSALTKKGKVSARASRTDNRTKPIVFVHGLDAIGTAGVDCASTWNNMANTLTGWGHSGTKATVMYYHGDTNCSYALDHHGSHSTHYPRTDAHQNGSHDMDGDIRHLGYHLAWMIYDHWSASNVTVDAVGHSMGGLILRYAIDRVEAKDPSFPSSLLVEDVVTLGTPHTGSGYAALCPWAYQCNQMNTGSSFMTWMAANAQNPQGTGGTDWTLQGSYDDGVVSQNSATGMTASHKVKYLGTMNIGHSDFMNDTSDVRDADVEWNDAPSTTWYSWYDAPHSVRWSDFALFYGSW
ncbi:MAG TPA: hypothetical protein VNT32_03950 [Thermoleophilaceae bacterium]|nr:hypothetical protein [Thermoleophilaceae bacterium]